MPDLISLTCPTCGANLEAAAAEKLVACEHCGNRYLLDKPLRDLNEAQRESLSPAVTYSNTCGQWLKVAGLDVLLHSLNEERSDKEHVLCAEVEYINRTTDPVKYRHDQWIVFDQAGYTYEATMDYLHPKLYEGKIYVGRTRILNPGMRLRGWLVFPLPAESAIECLQFTADPSAAPKTLEFRLAGS